MPTETTHFAHVTPLHVGHAVEMAEHGLYHAGNRQFFAALLEVLELLRVEALMRECHPIHEKLVEMEEFVKAEHCQDFTPSFYPMDFA